MSELSATDPSTPGPRSPLFGTATYSTLTTTHTLMSPSQRSSTSLSYTDTPSYDSDDPSTGTRMRRLNISPEHSSRQSDADTYSEEDSFDERAEVAALLSVDDEIEEVLDAWTRSPPDIDQDNLPSTPIDRDWRVLSTISEHTENISSRPTSFAPAAGSRPVTMHSAHSGEANRRSANLSGTLLPSIHARSSTEPAGPRPYTPTKGVSTIVAQFEAKRAEAQGIGSPFLQGHSRTASAPTGPRSPSPYTTTTTTSQTMPTLSTLTRDSGFTTGYTTSGLGSTTGYGNSSRPSSPTKSRTGSTVSGPRAPTSVSGISRATPSTHTRSQSVFTGTLTRTGTPTTTFTGLTGTESVTETETETGTETITPRASPLRRPQNSPREPLAQMMNIVNAWKRTVPIRRKSGQFGTSPSPSQTRQVSRTLPRESAKPATDARTSAGASGSGSAAVRSGPSGSGTETQSTSGLPPPFDAGELGITGEPIDIGQLWYLNVHGSEPFRWQRCQAMLYPHMLLLTWIAPTGGRGIVTLDLLNCLEVQSVPSPTHPLSRDDLGTIAAKRQSENAERGGQGVSPGDLGLYETLTPLHLVYSDGTERLGTESPRERAAWRSAIIDCMAVDMSDRSDTRSLTGSIRTIQSSASNQSSRSSVSVGSASTNYVAPLGNAEFADLISLSGSSSLSRRPSMASENTRALDDNSILNATLLPQADSRVIPPSRMSSLRRTSSMTDLDEGFSAALRHARNSRPGLGFGLSLVSNVPIGDGSPVTVSSGPRIGRDISLTPPPRDRSRVRSSSASSAVSDDPFFSARSGTDTRTPTSSWYSTNSSFTRALTSTEGITTTGTIVTGETVLDVISGTGTNVVSSTMSYRGTASASLLGDSHSGTTSSSPSRSGLMRSRGIRRRAPTSTASRTFTSSYLSGTEESSDKENSDVYSGSDSRATTDGPYTSEFSTLDSLTRTETDTYTSSEWTRSATPTPSSVSSSRPISQTASTDESEELPTPSTRSSEYVTAKSPATSFSSLPSIPSESNYDTAEICSMPSEYVTADVCLTETDFVTVDVCPTEVSSEYVTCEICRSDTSTEYGTAQCHCRKSPEPSSSEVGSILTIPSLVPESDVGEVLPEDIPLPLSSPATVSSLLSELELTPSPQIPFVRSPSTMSPPSLPATSTPSIPAPSLPQSPIVMPTLTSISTVSSLTESSVTPTVTTELTLTVPSTLPLPSISSPSISESVWAPETDRSFDTSVLRASPSAQSAAIPEGLDISFETSFLRPTTSGSRVSLVSPISELSTPTPSFPTSRSSSVTPTPSTLSLPASVPTPSPVLTEVSPTVRTRTPSSPSTVSLVSARPSVTEPILRDIQASPEELSTISSLLSDLPSVSARSLTPLPQPPSPVPATPSVSISLSVSTPHGSIPSIHSDLDTVPSEPPEPIPSTSPSNILTHDINRLLQYLHDIDQARGEENQDLRDNVREIRGLLGDLLDEVRQRGDVPPPPLHMEQAVGGNSIILSTPRSMAVEPQEPPATPKPVKALPDIPRLGTPRSIEPIELSPPRIRVPSPDTLTETMSFLSSHHSDDLSLLESEIYPVQGPGSPSWPSSSESSPESSPTSSSVSIEPRRIADIRRTPTPSLVSSSPTPSRSPSPSASSVTARPAPAFNLGDIRDILDGLRRQMGILSDGQDAANRMLDEVRQRPPVVTQELPDVNDRLGRIEGLLQNLADRPIPVPVPPAAVPRTQPPAADDVSESVSSDGSLLRIFRGILDEGRRDVPPIHFPTTSRTGPTLDEQLAELVSSEPSFVQAPVAQPPPLVPLIYRPQPRAARPRSASPTYEVDLPARSRSVPVEEPIFYPRRRPAPRPSRRRRSGIPHVRVPSDEEEPYPPTMLPEEDRRLRVPGPGPGPGPGSAIGDLDFNDEVRDLRRARRPELRDGFVNRERPPRATSAPPEPIQEDRPVDPSWYGQGVPGGVPPPGIFQDVPAQPGASTILQLPASVEDILSLLRENRLAQLATIDQQREIMRYMRGLNEWLERDVHDRQEEIRAVAARVDQLRDLLLQLLARPAEGPSISMPQPFPGPSSTVHPTPFGISMPQPEFSSERPVRPPVIPPIGTVYQTPFPPGFVPTGPVVPPFPEDRTASQSSDFSPVIPGRPSDGMSFSPHVPVIPQTPSGLPHQAFATHPQQQMADEGEVVPPRPPRSPTQSSEPYSDEGQEPEITIIPPPDHRPERLPETVRLPTSRRTSSSRRSSPDGVIHVQPPTPTRTVLPPGSQIPVGPDEYTQRPVVMAPTQAHSAEGRPIIIHPQPPIEIIRSSEGRPPEHDQQPVRFIVDSRHSPPGSHSHIDYPPSHRPSHSPSRTPSRSPRVPLDIVPSRQFSRSPPDTYIIQPHGPMATAPPVIVTRPGRSVSGSPPPQVIIRTESHGGRRPPRDPDYPERDSRSHSPRSPTVVIHGPSHHSDQPTRLVEGEPSPIIVQTGASQGSRAPTRIVRTGGHSRSRSPTRIVRSRSPTRIVRTGGHSRSRSPIRTVSTGGHSRSRSPRRLVRTGQHSRSRSPRRIVRTGQHSRSRSPTRIVRTSQHSRSRSPIRIVRTGGHSRSRSPRRIVRTGQHSRSRSPTRIVRTGGRSRSRSSTVIEGDHGIHGPRSPPARIVRIGESTRYSGSPASHEGDPGMVVRTGTRQRLPTRLVRTGGSSRSRSPIPVHPSDTSRTARPPPIVGRVRSSQAPVYGEAGTHPSRQPTVIVPDKGPIRVRVGRTASISDRSPPPQHVPSQGGDQRRLTPPILARPPSRVPPQERTHRRPGPPTIIRIPTEHIERSRAPSDVTFRPHSFYEEPTPVANPITPSGAPSRVSSLERAFSGRDQPGVIPVQRSTQRPVSPATVVRDQLRYAPPDEPTIPYIPSVGHTPGIAPTGEDVARAPVGPHTDMHIPSAAPYIERPATHRILPSRSPTPTPIPAPDIAERIPMPEPSIMQPPYTPLTAAPPRAYSGPMDLDYADAERERIERFGDLERQLVEHLQNLQDAEETRDYDFRTHEDEREQIFLQNEGRRDEETLHRVDGILRNVEDRLEERLASLPTAGLPPAQPTPGDVLPEVVEEDEAAMSPPEEVHMVPPPGFIPRPEDMAEDADAHTIAQSIETSVMDAASRHAQEILETVRLEREESAREREVAQAEREQILRELVEERQQMDADRQEELRGLREELAATKDQLASVQAELDQERQLRISEDTERREADRTEDRQRAEDLTTQLSEVTQIVSETRDELARKREDSDERCARKEAKCEQQEAKMEELKEMMTGMRRMMEESRDLQAEQRAADAAKPSIESVVEELRRENQAMRELLESFRDGMRADILRQHEELLGAVRASAQEQVPFNISGYLDEFSKTLAKEVRQLLTEVNSLVEDKSRLQFEIAALLEFKARYDPGGIFWRQGAPMPPVEVPPTEPPPPPPPPPGPPEPVPSAWRPKRQRRPRAAPPPPVPAPPSVPTTHDYAVPVTSQQPRPSTHISWPPEQWRPGSDYEPSSDASMQPPEQLLVPQQPSPGLFGPRSPPESLHYPQR